MIEINGKIYRNLQEQVDKNKDDIDALQQDLTGVYTKAEVDTKIGAVNSSVETCQSDIDILKQNKANTTDVYSKTEIDVMLENVGTSDDVYTKVEVNNLLSGKANATDVYSKSEIDNLITGALESDY